MGLFYYFYRLIKIDHIRRNEMISNLIKVADRLDSLGLNREADMVDAIIRMASSDNTPEGLIKFYQTEEGKGKWRDQEPEFYGMAKNDPVTSSFKDSHYSDWNTDDFKKVIFAVNGRDEFAYDFSESEAERIEGLLGYTESDSGGSLTQEQVVKLLTGHFDKGTRYTMSKGLMDKITSVNINMSDLEDADVKYLKYSV
jgi:hypothetical protein